MITSLSFRLKYADNININTNFSSLFHGFIMENISSDYADKIHKSSIHPYNQHLEEGGRVWRISALNDEAGTEIIDKIKDLPSVYLKYKQLNIGLAEPEIKTLSYDELLPEGKARSKGTPAISISFITPTAFKKYGSYINYPTVRSIFSGIIKKYDLFSQVTPLYSKSLTDEIEIGVSVLKYNLKSGFFHLEGIKINSFTGNLTLKVGKNCPVKKEILTLAEFANYSGIGIKTAIGMGAVNIKTNPGSAR